MTDTTQRFLAVKSIEDLADVLGYKVNTLLYYCKKNQSFKCYNVFTVNKKSGGVRLIHAPNKQLKFIQKKLSDILYDIYSPKKIVTGFVKGKSVVDNANVHKNKRQVLNIDIENFFDSIHFGRVFGIFQGEPFSFERKIALALSQLVCCNGRLAQGSPTSPIISNFICRKLDSDLIKLTAKYKLVCTRYCDDITFSTKANKFPAQIAYSNGMGIVIGEELSEVLRLNSFTLNNIKTRLQTNKSRQMVTGLVVNEKPNILNKRYRKFRAILHYAYCNGLKAAAKKNVLKDGVVDAEKFDLYLRGTINYYKKVMGKSSSKYCSLAKKYNELNGNEVFEVPSSFEEDLEKYVFIIEDEEKGFQGTGFLVKDVGLVTCLHVVASLGKEPDVTELAEHIREKVRIYLPQNPEKYFIGSLVKSFYKEDLLVLNIGKSKSLGFEYADDRFEQNKDQYISAGYPSYAVGNTIDKMNDVKIRGTDHRFGQEYYSVDKTFTKGASGGPVFNQNRKVVGYIDRGDEFSGDPKEISAFCSLKVLFETI